MLSYIFPLLYVISFLHAGQYISVGDNVRYYQHSPDLYFAMEHVTTEAQALLWHDLLGIMDTPSTSVSPPVMSHIQYMLDNQIMGVPGVRNRVSYGAGGAGPETLRHVMKTFGSENPVELWIGYAWSSTEPPTGPIKVEDLIKIEMAFTVTTRAPYLYTWHMGISRNSLWSRAPSVIIHKGIAVSMHAFAAYVMKKEHPGIYYVMTQPGDEMNFILEKALHQHVGQTVFFSWDGIIDRESDGTRRLYTLSGSADGRQLIWEGPEQEFNWPRHGGTGGQYFLADISTLAAEAPIDD